MPISKPLLIAVVVLVAWTMVVLCWMYATRLPAMKAARIRPDPTAPRGAQMSTLPARVRWKSDNYTNLTEQPTVFYAVVIVLALLDQGTPTNVALAWSYVGLRILHTLVQTLVNKIEARFVVFILASFVLVALVVNTLRAVL